MHVHCCTAAPSAVDPALTSRHLPVCWLTTVYVLATPATGRKFHSCWSPPSQENCCWRLPSVVARLVLSRHCWLCWATATDWKLPSDGGRTVMVNVSSASVCGR